MFWLSAQRMDRRKRDRSRTRGDRPLFRYRQFTRKAARGNI